MKQIRTSLNKTEFEKFSKQCEKLGETEYRYVKNAVKERMTKTENVFDKLNRVLWEP